MKPTEDEEALLRSVALQNAQSILLARQRAEEELVRAKEALELKTRELAHTLAMMRATLESTTDGVLVTDGRGNVTDFNQKFVEMWRMSRDAMESGDHRRVLIESSVYFKDPEQFLERVDDIYASSPPESYDLLELADGRAFERFSRIQFVDEKNVGRVWSVRDITDFRVAEQTLRKQSELLRVTLASIGDAVVTTDTERRVVLLNGMARTLTGWTQQEAQGRELTEVFRIINEETRQPVRDPVARALDEGKIVGLANGTILISRDGAETPIDDSAAPIRDDKGQVYGAVLVFRDIAERKKAEKALRGSERELSSLLAALKEADQRKDEFLAMLAHELRNPLAPIRNAVQILRAVDSPEPELRWATDVIDRQAHQMTRLVDDLLDLSRITRGKIDLRKEVVELAAVVNSAVEDSRPLIEKLGHELIVTVSPQPIFLEADPTRLSQVLLNLINNAAKYTDQVGRIWLTAEQHGDHVVIRVKDTGIGIPSEMLPRVFEMFTQVDASLERAVGGLGIGLTLVHRLIEMHGGTVEAHSEGPGKGSEFIISLPFTSGLTAREPLTAIADGQQQVTYVTRRILVVDDNLDSAESLVLLLRMMGNEVNTAHDGLEAVAVAAEFRPDVVLLDIGLPMLNGYEAARLMRKQLGGGEMVLVALTGWGQEEDRRRSREAGFDHHLTKPVDFATLRELIAGLDRTD